MHTHPVATKLQIVWDGEVVGLADRRLSLSAFEPALRQLLATIRRIASDLEVRATGPREHGRGRLAREAAKLDIQISEVRGNSPLTVTASVVNLEPPARPLIADLADVAIDEFLRDMERESAGAPSHYQVRRFMRALPPGLTQQRYTHTAADGSPGRDLTLGAIRVEDPRVSPYLVEVTGVLVGVVFELGRSELRLRSTDGDLMGFAATTDEVETALPFRLKTVTVLGVMEHERQKPRLLRFTTEQSPEAFLDPTARLRHLSKTWNTVLTRLAQ